MAAYPAGSAARDACKAFNYSYTSLLKALHATFNGTPRALTPAIGLMGSLQQQALDMMSGATTDGVPPAHLRVAAGQHKGPSLSPGASRPKLSSGSAQHHHEQMPP